MEHSFHIPVMGTGFSIDTPVKVAPFGISSVISLADDSLIEKMRAYYCSKLNLPFEEISERLDDFRAKRITAYLNLIDQMVKEKFETVKRSALEKSNELTKYLEMLPDYSELKQEYQRILDIMDSAYIKDWVYSNLQVGSIDVNIMTKVDKTNFDEHKQALPSEYNDAHAALRGFANSNLESCIILSAGMNPRLYGYMEVFDDFYPDQDGSFRKKIVLKVSDYRSALIQGKFLAKKGLWVSEYRIESGLNCGGHAFATDGYLFGPVLEEFKEKRESLTNDLQRVWKQALIEKGRPVATLPTIKITAQGGVGTADEHHLLLDHYQLDSVGWGTPFLLVPEATNVDKGTLDLLASAGEGDQYLSNTSPLGVPFNTLRGNSQDLEKERRITKGRPGSPCPKKFLVSNTEYSEKPVCTASREYQFKKLQEIKKSDPIDSKNRKHKVHEKSCLCMGLANGVLENLNLKSKKDGKGVSVCPGPNIAYFDRTVSLQTMVAHIYGKEQILGNAPRPNLFVKEFRLYLDFLKEKLSEALVPSTSRQQLYFSKFKSNLEEGLDYYQRLFNKLGSYWTQSAIKELKEIEGQLKEIG